MSTTSRGAGRHASPFPPKNSPPPPSYLGLLESWVPTCFGQALHTHPGRAGSCRLGLRAAGCKAHAVSAHSCNSSAQGQAEKPAWSHPPRPPRAAPQLRAVAAMAAGVAPPGLVLHEDPATACSGCLAAVRLAALLLGGPADQLAELVGAEAVAAAAELPPRAGRRELSARRHQGRWGSFHFCVGIRD